MVEMLNCKDAVDFEGKIQNLLQWQDSLKQAMCVGME